MIQKNRPLMIVDRKSHQLFEEEVWGGWALRLLYGDSWMARTVGRSLLHLVVRWPYVSWLVGKWYDCAWTRRYIRSFCQRFSIDTDEFLLPIEEFRSFNDFFTRHLREDARPQVEGEQQLIVPADGRYTIIPQIDCSTILPIKGRKYSLSTLLGDHEKATLFCGGSAVLARLAPVDCHRFYFPITARVGEPRWIHGSLFSVNPIAIERRPWIFWKNRRTVTFLEASPAGTIAYIEVGATHCGSIVQTFGYNTIARKGREKGYFRLGGSTIILLFEPGRVRFADDLIELSSSGCEIYCQIGQELATAVV